MGQVNSETTCVTIKQNLVKTIFKSNHELRSLVFEQVLRDSFKFFNLFKMKIQQET